MPLETINGLVLFGTDYRENDKILTVLSPEKGKLSIASRGCKRSSSTLLSASEQFAFSEMVVVENYGRYTLKEAYVKELFYPLRNDYLKFAAAAFIMQASDHISFLGEPNSIFFTMLYHVLSYLAYTDIEPFDIVICFMARLLFISGMASSITSCAVCGKSVADSKLICFSPKAGGSLCHNCDDGSRMVSSLSLEALRRMFRIPDKRIRDVVLPKKTRQELAAVLDDYFEYVLEHRFKTYEFFINSIEL
ncbi:MAG: DNA repair protein RecO [Clostridia bacterium]|nr:DNA repair protein RecO [Clostridia bacterium]